MKEKLFSRIDMMKKDLCTMADTIFDNPELDSEEYEACKLLSDYMNTNGFAVEVGIGGKETSFRAVYEHGTGGPSIGLLCEYDALPSGHACGHHLQGPAICGAAVALKEIGISGPFKIVVYGTPAEEQTGGKIVMLENGCFQDIDFALMFHADSVTFADHNGLASQNFTVTYHGIMSHAAISPEEGRSALDALMLAFQGIEFFREHVTDDARMHYTVWDAGGPPNMVPDHAVGEFCLRAANTAYLENTIIERFYDILKGAALMTGTTYEVSPGLLFMGKIPVQTLDDLLTENARRAGAPRIVKPHNKTGSTDFGNVMSVVPGSCINVAYPPAGSALHTQAFLDYGKSPEAHDVLLAAAKSLGGTVLDILERPELLPRIRQEFAANKAALA